MSEDGNETRARGSEAVKAALVAAAADMLGEVGPRGISVRDVALRAGVNHGQVHHYFGGKRGLLKAAMKSLALEHYEHARELAGPSPFPPLLSLAQDVGYWRALCQCIMEGDLELARVEIDEDISVPHSVLRRLHSENGPQPNDFELRARFATMVAAQLGWVAFEDFVMAVAEVDPGKREAFREEAKKVLEGVVEQLLD